MKKTRILSAVLAFMLTAISVPFQPVMAEEETEETLTYGVLSYQVEENYSGEKYITLTDCDTTATEQSYLTDTFGKVYVFVFGHFRRADFPDRIEHS